jgi:DNA-binding IclR family transcriptional regulator
LAGYIAAGFAVHDPASGRYQLGPLALEIGLAAIRRIDVVSAADEFIEPLRDAVRDTVSVTVWGNRGPTVVRWLEGPQPVSLATNLGNVLPVTRSANGLVFAAFLPEDITAHLIDSELAVEAPGNAERRRLRRAFAAQLDEVRATGLSVSDNGVQPGISSLAAPIFSHDGTIAASIAVVGVHGVFDLSAEGRPANELRVAARRISERLGAVPSSQ